MKKCLLVAFACLCSIMVNAQTAMAKAYIITEKGDTIRGEAKPNKKELDNYSKVTFKDQSGNQKLYRPTKIVGYGINDEHYIAMDSESEGDRKFYKVLARGDINMYKLGYEAMRMNVVVFDVEYYISHKSAPELEVVKEAKFRKQVSGWMEDNLEFINAYGDEKEFNLEKALAAITQYNSWKASK